MTAMEQKENLSYRLLLCCQNELYSLYPYLDGAFASLRFRISEETKTMGTDGRHLLFCPDFLVGIYGENPGILRRGSLHILIHCLFLHPFRRFDRDPKLWNLACDMAVEQILHREQQPRLEISENAVRTRCLEQMGETPLGAEVIYEMLLKEAFSDPPAAMEAAFLLDDHSLWGLAGAEDQRKWEHVLSYTSENRNGKGSHAGSQAGDKCEILENLPAGTRDYRKYLRQFAVSREEMELDPFSFDYIYYNLGMERYGNLPLLEPLEYREGHKLQQLVIAIDTSGSCDRDTVRNFLSETYGILSSRENFFQKMEVHLIQCDCLIQSAAVIHSQEEWKKYSREIRIEGRGGTDFTPVFRYVDELRDHGKLRDLKALLYFTDGDGYFPREKPSYETAFVFLHPNEFMEAVPAWAQKLLVNNR